MYRVYIKPIMGKPVMVQDSDEQVSYLPAAPGWDVLTYYPDDKEFDSNPVVAWAILCSEDEGFVRAFPVTCNEAWSLNDDRCVCLPSGMVVWGDLQWSTTAEWLEYMIEHESDPAPKPLEIKRGSAGVLALDSFRHKFRGDG